MKVSFYFAFRELLRRPRRVISMLLVAAAIMTALNMLLFYLEANWRQQVMPDNKYNYHFSVRDISDADRAYIISQPWVQAYYDIDVENYYGEYQYYELRVRVDWDNVLYVNALARDVFEELDLWRSRQYQKSYDQMEANIRKSMQMSWKPWETERNGLTFDQWLERNTKASFIRSVPTNTYFCRLTVDNYIMRPEFAVYMGLFTCFLGSTMTILFSEQYKQNLAEFGTMRAYGMKKRQIVYINSIETLLITLAAIPISWCFTGLTVWLYNLATRHLDDGTAYLNLGRYLPLGAMAIVSVMMLAASLAGCLLVCWLNRNQTVIEQLRGTESERISFVSKTSPRFDDAGSLDIYDRLYITRTRATFFLGALILALMLPLPLYYFTLCTSLIGTSLSGSDMLVAIYHVVQAALMFITAIAVTFASTRQSCDTRVKELAILRAMGVKRSRVRKSAYTPAVLQAIITAVLASFLFFYLTDTGQHISSLPTHKAVKLGELIERSLLQILGGAFLILPPTLGGIAASLHWFFGRSTIVNLREKEF